MTVELFYGVILAALMSQTPGSGSAIAVIPVRGGCLEVTDSLRRDLAKADPPDPDLSERLVRYIQARSLLLIDSSYADTTSPRFAAFGELTSEIGGRPQKAWQAAAFLSHMMRASGAAYSSQYAQFAARLYAQWRLPADPALSVLLDGDSPRFARLQALYAALPELSQNKLKVLAVAVLCDVGAIAQGRLETFGLTTTMASSDYMTLVLDRDERETALALANEFLGRREEQVDILDRLRILIGTDNPVTLFLTAYWR